jgi:DNA-binding NtrC family response regulator
MAQIVLVVDGDRRLRQSIKQVLADSGYDARTASNQIEVRDAIGHDPQNDPACYIMDSLDPNNTRGGQDMAKTIVTRLKKPVIWTSAFEPAPAGTTAVPKGGRFRERLLAAVLELIGKP